MYAPPLLLATLCCFGYVPVTSLTVLVDMLSAINVLYHWVHAAVSTLAPPADAAVAAFAVTALYLYLSCRSVPPGHAAHAADGRIYTGRFVTHNWFLDIETCVLKPLDFD